MISTIRIYLIAAAIAVVVSGLLWCRHALIEQGKAECQASVQRAIAQQEKLANENAAIYEAQKEKTRIEYRTRVKEVVKNVPVNHGCDLPNSTVRLLNNAISGDKSPR